ncbi:MAG: M14 family zinc carboxypeptidase [Actinomycetes bacterium]
MVTVRSGIAIGSGRFDRWGAVVPILVVMDPTDATDATDATDHAGDPGATAPTDLGDHQDDLGDSSMDRRTFLARAGLTGAAAFTASGLLVPDAAFAADGLTKIVIGHSTKGRPIRAWRLGDKKAKNVYLVLGQMHGDEPAGRYLALNRLINKDPIKDVALWVVPTMNPDGNVRATRVNARGVDLNRNFPSKTWVKQGKGTRYWSGPRPASEPETRAIVRFFSRIQPRTIVSIHQPLSSVDFSGGEKDVTRWLSRALNLPVANLQVSGGGTMTSWYNAEFPKKTAVTVELPPTTTPQYRNNVAEALVRHAKHRKK